MPRRNEEDEARSAQLAEEAAAAEAAEAEEKERLEAQGVEPGESAYDEPAAKLRVEVTTHFTIGRTTYAPNQRIEVPDGAEARAGLAVGFLRLLEAKESLSEGEPATV